MSDNPQISETREMTDRVPAILSERRTVFQFRPDPISESLVSKWLASAVWAPNHHMTEPWRFYVVGGQAKERLAQLNGALQAEKHADKPHVERIRTKGEQEFLDPPVVIVVTQPGAEERDPVGRDEDYAACCLAAYNLMLAAWSDGVGSGWSTGRLSRAAEARDILGLESGERIVAVLRLGHPLRVPPMQRQPWSDHTRWLT